MQINLDFLILRSHLYSIQAPSINYLAKLKHRIGTIKNHLRTPNNKSKTLVCNRDKRE